ncbi:hypothetical protein COS31_00235 [Candidatus Roizmanbacteria bacterium CG02_land_8_20_14_3_00_36_15]|uniref:N-acetyltransferase domain-containing protein n=2 Tax=Candidatus Roizmaniibacteriota TaxID=1752723 RepID=A0A2M8KJY8_9BACT|nr:MAG: hypothetical protein COS51_04785 [Candidatus Roizmanbacteria bacterium CG03_land_8_20_14_0_80_36_21]PIV38292.1 MAG: hypothetical protein COS31_00235 [Candidatus Roizmanbacteria bacterium CG02_land_8_20_14_3_00_36_15]PIY69821.1 MAG: hypothetical protein COY89_04400 [Candidatus Roizmanbacteria bacterium CG_4_10_14_0_8_um_filter_36_36]PJA53446.1 MAG: hypothetical protein CO166_01850 [Candidatus Roizmanbacteria bacterium CG_4_9_14_3_um_filter_36_11]PJC81447.1 MAG: hypothetical protein CO007
MEPVIEILAKKDVGSFYPVFAQALKQEFPCYSQTLTSFFLEKVYTPTNFIYWLNYDLKTIIVVKNNSEIIGFAVIDQPYGGVSFCRWLAVLPAYQKKGLGRKLINAWIELAQSQKCHKVELASQPIAKKFYEKVDLTNEGERKLSYFGVDQTVFGKIIGPLNEEVMTKYY